MKDVRAHWQLCKISAMVGESAGDAPKEWNGIYHLPTWTSFKIVGDKAEIVGPGMPKDNHVENELKKLAVKRFKALLKIKHAKCEICKRKIEPDLTVCVKCWDAMFPEVWEDLLPRRHCRDLPYARPCRKRAKVGRQYVM